MQRGENKKNKKGWCWLSAEKDPATSCIAVTVSPSPAATFPRGLCFPNIRMEVITMTLLTAL